MRDSRLRSSISPPNCGFGFRDCARRTEATHTWDWCTARGNRRTLESTPVPARYSVHTRLGLSRTVPHPPMPHNPPTLPFRCRHQALWPFVCHAHVEASRLAFEPFKSADRWLSANFANLAKLAKVAETGFSTPVHPHYTRVSNQRHTLALADPLDPSTTEFPPAAPACPGTLPPTSS